MANELKKLVVKEMVSQYRNTDNYLVVGYQGINSLQFDELRKNLRKKKIYLEIVKNSLAAIAFKEIGIAGIVNLLTGPSAIATGKDDPVIMAKETIEWSKKIPAFSLRGGFVDGSMLSAEDIKNLAKLPTMPVLRTQIVTGINAPIVGVVSSFNAVLRGLATVFQAIKDKKEKSGE
ncbi:MAG TPA: 50S ribosomal protein L10 [Candidatus Wunengus sp. YC60]|uniref:50S ribosomal protein L10 n=1 Tax=Candidatus Wunengus sp. YC60 TaxID=3367697 RepID=UPI0040287056